MPISVDEVERQAVQEFAFLLSDRGFRGPVVRRSPFSLSLDYLNTEIGIELAFDLRDVDLTILLVRLVDGHLPSGYYISNGRRCRVYLVTWLAQMGRYEAPATAKRRHGSANTARSPMDALKGQLSSSRDLIAANIDLIENQGLSAFETI